jgi:LemA protein
MTVLFVVIGVVVAGLIYLIILYNRLVTFKNNRENAFADIDVQLKQRHDLIPQLVSVVKNYTSHEKKVLLEITEARAAAMSAGSISEKIGAERKLGMAMNGFQIAMEAYPDLKANQNFLQLQEEISDIENKLAAVRRFFNSATKELNIGIESFPANLIAGGFGFKKKTMFDVGPATRDELEKGEVVDF